jgi:hypothetical protein
VDLGLITFDVPADWVITTVPSGSLEIGPYGEEIVEVHVTIPCPLTIQAMLNLQMMTALQTESGGVPIIDVEGYVEGELIGGIELQFETEQVYYTLLPLTMKH